MNERSFSDLQVGRYETNNSKPPVPVLRKGLRFLLQRGPGETAVLVRKNVAAGVRYYLNRRFDRKFGVDTSGVVRLADLTCSSANKDSGIWYEPTPLRTLKRVFSLLGPDARDLTFIDFGSGKGRTLLFASHLNFRRIIGVEFARELHEVAEENIRVYRSRQQKCFDIRSICSDAADFVLPDENCVLYFFHPFRADVMERVLSNVQTWYERRPRQLLALYYHPAPECQQAIDNFGFLRKRGEHEMPLDLSGEHCIYRRRLAIYEGCSRPGWARDVRARSVAAATVA